jgi:hypothetical protein
MWMGQGTAMGYHYGDFPLGSFAAAEQTSRSSDVGVPAFAYSLPAWI